MDKTHQTDSSQTVIPLTFKGKTKADYGLSDQQWAFVYFWLTVERLTNRQQIAQKVIKLLDLTTSPSDLAHRCSHSKKVKKAIAELGDMIRDEKNAVYASRVLNEEEAKDILSATARASVLDYVDSKGRLLPPDKMGDPRAIKKIRTMERDGTSYAEIELKDGMKAMETLGSWSGWGKTINAANFPSMGIYIGTDKPESLTGPKATEAIEVQPAAESEQE